MFGYFSFLRFQDHFHCPFLEFSSAVIQASVDHSSMSLWCVWLSIIVVSLNENDDSTITSTHYIHYTHSPDSMGPQ